MKTTTTIKALVLSLGMLPTVLGTVAVISNPATAATQQQRYEYNKCAKISLAVYRNGLERAGGNSAKIRAERRHYQANIVRCQRILR